MAFIEFSTQHYPQHERTDIARETCATMSSIAPDIEDGGALDLSVRIRLLPGVSVALFESSPIRVTRSAQQLADGNDDVLLFLNPGSPPGHAPSPAWTVRQHQLGEQGEAVCTSLSGCLALNERSGTTQFHLPNSRCLLLAFPRERLMPQIANIDHALRHNLPSNTLALRLLTQQALALTQQAANHPQQTDDAAHLHLSQQLLDLSVLAVGATPQAQARANARGLRQVRLKAIMADLRIHAGRGDLTLEWVAARHGISASYVRALFAQQNTTFSDYLLGLRLQRTFERLSSPRYAGCTVSTIAYDAGFNNLSWFYRAFKQRFGIAPGEARQPAAYTHSEPL